MSGERAPGGAAPTRAPRARRILGASPRILAERTRAKEVAQAVVRWQPFLLPGVYRAAEKAAWHTTDNGIRSLVGTGLLSSVPARPLLRRLLGVERRVVLQEAAPRLSGFRGSVLLAKRRKILIADAARALVLHAYFLPRRFAGHADRPDSLVRHVPAPRVVTTLAAERVLVEELVKGRGREEWSSAERSAATDFLFRAVAGYLKEGDDDGQVQRATTPKEVLDGLAAEEELGDLVSYFEVTFPFDIAPRLAVPQAHGHGDLRLSNLVKTGSGFVAIDWEFSRVQPFFFDALHWLFLEWRYHGDPGPLRKYLEGEYDELLRPVFDAVGVRFEPALRGLYLGVYLADRIRDRAYGKSAADRRKQVAYYHRLLANAELRRLLVAR